LSQRASIVVFFFCLAVLGGATPALGASERAADYPTIFIVFNSNSTLTVTLENGAPLGTTSGAPTVIPPGTYNLDLTDPTFVSDVQLHLEGPGVKLISNMSYGEEPSETWVETFAPGSTYTWRDDMKPGTVWTFVTSNTTSVGSANPGSAPGAGKSTSPISSGKNGKASSTDIVGSAIKTLAFRGTLIGSVSAAGKLTLKLGSKPVTNLKAGRYTFKITDGSKKAGFTVQEIKNPSQTLTTTTFTGTRSRTIALKAGQWLFYPTFVGKKTYFIVTS
jgi:hypothetical protein